MRELVAKVAKRLGCSEAQARLSVEAVVEALAAGCSVRGFGTFKRAAGKLSFRVAKARRESKAD